MFLGFLVTPNSIALAQKPEDTPPQAKIHSVTLVGIEGQDKKTWKLRVRFSTNQEGADRSCLYVRRVDSSEEVRSHEEPNPKRNKVYQIDFDAPIGGWVQNTPYTVHHHARKQGTRWNGIVQFQFTDNWDIQYIEPEGGPPD